MAQELDLRTRVEIETLYEILDEVDYYALLQVGRDAQRGDIEKAFAQESRKFHPDRYFGVRDAVLVRKLTTIYRKVSEAYSVLKDGDLKNRYDAKLGIGDAGGMDLSRQALQKEAKAAKKTKQMVCNTRQGRRYYELAMTAQRNGNQSAYVMNLQFALSFERDNEPLKKMLEEARQEG